MKNNVNLKKDKKIFKDFKEINTSSKKFNETVQLKKILSLILKDLFQIIAGMTYFIINITI